MIVLLLTILSLAVRVFPAEVFAGCFDPQLIQAIHLTPQTYNPDVITCPQLCSQQYPSTIYAYSRKPNGAAYQPLCWCTTFPPDATYLLDESSCPFPDISAELVHPPPNWTWYKCFDFLSLGPVDLYPANAFPVSSITQCLDSCSNYPHAFFSYLDDQNMSCACYQRGPPFTIDFCGEGFYYHYYNTFGPTPSQRLKRRISNGGFDKDVA